MQRKVEVDEGLRAPHFLFLNQKRMIVKDQIEQVVNEWLEGKDYFLVDLQISADNKITVEIDQKEGVWIEDCVALSQFIESKLDGEMDDYDLEVGSAGIGQPLKVLRQFENCIGQEVEVKTRDGRKLTGTLKAADENGFSLTMQVKVKEEGMKRPKLVEQEVALTHAETDYVKQIIKFK